MCSAETFSAVKERVTANRCSGRTEEQKVRDCGVGLRYRPLDLSSGAGLPGGQAPCGEGAGASA